VAVEPLPTFLILGAQKSATRWLRLNLGLHPDVFTADTEIGFFSGAAKHRSGPEWYAAQFEGWAGERIVGEATPAYMMHRHHPPTVADRIQAFRPEMRLLAVLRNPADRTYSAFVHHMLRKRIPPETDLLDRVRSVDPEADPLGLVAGSWYHRSLLPFAERFGDQLLVLLHDDVKTGPAEVYDRALAHVGAEPGFRPPGFEEVRFGNRPPAASGLRAGDAGYKPLTAEQRVALWDLFRDDVAALEQMLGRSLAAWDPERAPEG
jgi:hypothetical protein